MYRFFIKRVLDVLISFFGLLVTSPAFIFISIVMYFQNEGKIFFLQKRPGKNGKVFKVIKFKSMNDRKDKDGILLPDSQRLTSVGRFIRKTSLDEIPQLINVFIGNMSIIGPRPLVVEYLPLYSEEQARRHEARPGITGWAQVNGRNSISWKEKFEYDVWYVDHISFKVDFKIFLLTIKKVIKKEGIDFDASIKDSRFDGNN